MSLFGNTGNIASLQGAEQGFCHCEIQRFRPYLVVGFCRFQSSAENGRPAVFPRTLPYGKVFLVLMIRLARVGARKQPHYRVVVIEKDRARNGRSIEVVGTYNPRTNPASVDFKRDRIDYWTSKGAQLSDRVQKLLASVPAVESAPAA